MEYCIFVQEEQGSWVGGTLLSVGHLEVLSPWVKELNIHCSKRVWIVKKRTQKSPS